MPTETQGLSDPKKLVWIQLAQVGTFKGHPAGGFEFTPAVFSNIVRNFEHDGLPIPIDAEHASEMKPSDGNIPVEGAPAMGWIHSLDNRGRAGLWGQVEWLEPARSYIKEGRYRYISPAVRFKSKDRVTGADTGPRLSSAGITNTPFLPSLQPLTASNKGEVVYTMSLSGAAEEATVAMGASTYCYSTNEYMPAIKAALRLPELCSATQCAEHLGMLRDHLASVGGDHTAIPQGVPLSSYLMPLRDLTRVPINSSWDDMLDVVQDMIDAAITEHEAEYHSSDKAADSASMSIDEPVTVALPADSPSAQQGSQNQTEQLLGEQVPAEQFDASAENKSTETTITMTTPTIPTVAAPAAAAPVATPVAETTVVASAEVGTLMLKLRGAEAEARRLQDEVVTLRAWKEEREASDLANEVMAAYETYSERKGLKPEDRAHMLTFLRNDPDGFHGMYPPVPVAQRHLLRSLTTGPMTGANGGGPQAPGAPRVPADKPNPFANEDTHTLSIRDLSKQIARQRGIPLGQAQIEAARIVRNKRAGNG